MAIVAIDVPQINTLRGTLTAARLTIIDQIFELEEATNAFKEAARLFKPGSTQYIAADERQRQAAAALKATRDLQETPAYDALQQGIFTWMIDRSREDFITVEDDIARLDQRFPIVMFPIRIETRFDGTLFKVRVFPDEIFLNRHEVALTREEQEAGKKYFDDFNEKGEEIKRWQEIIQRFGPERSAYICKVMQPSGFNTTPDPKFPCGATLVGGQKRPLTYPTNVRLRAAEWTRPGEAVLPDRWVVVTYRNGFRKVHVGRPIVEPLAMTTDPALPATQQTSISSNPAYMIDDKLRWTVDFERAKHVGMGIEITLDPTLGEDAIGTGGFDRVIVFGVKSSMDPQFTTLSLISLLDGHHHTRGLACVRQGTPTNNVKDSPTPFPPEDEDGNRSFGIEREHPPEPLQIFNNCLPPQVDGTFLALGLGVPSGVFANVDRAQDIEIGRDISMRTALWPLTYGYFMKYLMGPTIFSDTQIKNAKSYFSAFVHARGFTPAIRVGATPYGILPAVSLYNWQPTEAEGVDILTAPLIDPLQRLVPIWLDASIFVPRVTGNATDPDVELMSILSTYPSAKEVRVRHGVGRVTWYNIFNFFGWSFTHVEQRLNQLTEQLFRRIGHPEWRPPIGGVVFDPEAWRLLTPLVVATPSETKSLPDPNFILGIRNASVQDLKNDNVSGKPTSFNFLYALLRHATLAEYGRIADALADAAHKWTEPELFGFPSQPVQQSLIAEELALLASAIQDELKGHFAALENIAPATTAELERLLSEALDVSSHRLDAWVTGVATQRLLSMRALNKTGQYMGGYAWVENVRPIQRTFKTVDQVGTFETQPGTGGFIHTPSMTHAAAAAILRSAHISVKAEDPAKFAVDLSSRRVRNARRALDEVRAGQPLGAILGYRFERGLHEGHPTVPDLDKIRFAFRNMFPLVAGKNGVDTGELAENIAARNVVDGLALLRARRSGVDLRNDPRLPAPLTIDQFNAVKEELDKLDDLHDSVADLLTAESVYQLARGNIAGGSPVLENPVVGAPPPDPAIAKSPRTGIGIAHRVALVFPKDSSTADIPSGWPATPTPRALAEPHLDAWLGRVLGDPSKVTCQVTFTEAPGSATVSLSQLGLRPLDVMALARVTVKDGLGSVLDARVLTAALGTDATKTNVKVDYGPSPTRKPEVDRTFPEILEVARALGTALAGARPLEIGDLLSPSELEDGVADAESTAVTDAKNIEDRARVAIDALREIASSTTVSADRSLARAVQVVDPAHPTAVEIQNLRAALVVAAQFVPERAFPPRTASGVALLALAQAMVTELTRRLGIIDDLPAPPTLAKDRVALATLKLQTIFGNDFVALPNVSVPRHAEIDSSLAARADLYATTDPLAPSRYLQQAGRARANLRRFQKFSIFARALGRAPLALNVVQLPFVAGERWLGLELGTTDPKEGRAGVLLLSEAATPDTTEPWRGVMLEQWTEIIPAKEERTAIAFHYDTPRAAAPQSILVAVPAHPDVPWIFEDLIATLNETLDLAKVRAVDSELLPLGQALPLSLLAQNDAPDVTVATLFSAFVGAPDPLAFKGFS